MNTSSIEALASAWAQQIAEEVKFPEPANTHESTRFLLATALPRAALTAAQGMG